MRKGIEIRACELKRNFINQPSKVLIEKEMQHEKNNMIEKYECTNGMLARNNDEIVDEIYNYYNDLMSKDRVNESAIDNYIFEMTPLNDKDRDFFLEKEITYEEVFEVINKMKGSSPGPNGLTLGFFKNFFLFLVFILLIC